MTDGGRGQLLEWAAAGAPLEGEPVSGDVSVVVEFERGALVALIDGLGHGHEAAEASRAAADILVASPGEPLDALVARCHEGLRKSRGAVMSLASIDAGAGSVTWLGIGNVEGVLLRPGPGGGRDTITLRGGVVGYQLPPLKPASRPVSAGDTLVLASDGIRGGFTTGLDARGTPRLLAERILSGFHRRSDDALVLVARYHGAAP
jgi:hypothetical protein